MTTPGILTLNGESSSVTFALFKAGEPLWQILDGSMCLALAATRRTEP